MLIVFLIGKTSTGISRYASFNCIVSIVLPFRAQESRHAFGMRALGLPNTKHFHEITRIEDALACEFFRHWAVRMAG